MSKLKKNYEIELLKAVEAGLIDTTEELLDSNHGNLDDRNFNYDLVLKALYKRHVDLAILLIEKGFTVHEKVKTPREETILHVAVRLKDLGLITILLKKGALQDILTFDKLSKTPLHLAIDNYYLSMIDLFLSHLDSKTLDDNYFLHYAVERSNIQVILQLIAKGLSLSKKDEKGMTPFSIALKNENFEIVDLLLSKDILKDIDPNIYEDIAPVYISVIRKSVTPKRIKKHVKDFGFSEKTSVIPKSIKKYVDSGFPINISLNPRTEALPCLKKYTGFTLLHLAVKRATLEIAKFLINAGADVVLQNNKGSSPLHIAFEAKEIGLWKTWQDFEDNNSIIDLILNNHLKFKSNPVNKHGVSHFHIACSRDDPIVVEHFLKLGALINQPVSSECHLFKEFSPLHFAAKFRCKKTTEILLKNGADVKHKDSQEMTALHIASRESCLETVRLLLQYGADVDSVDCYGNTPLHWAFENKSYKIIDLLLSVPNVANSNPTNSEGISHFHIACTRNNVDVVKSFIERGVSLDACFPVQFVIENNSGIADWSGYSPLHLAVCHNRAKIVELLLLGGANVEIKNNKGFTPFQLACQYTFEMFGELIESKITRHSLPITDIVWVDEKIVDTYNEIIEKIDWSSNRKDYLKIISLLLDYEYNVNYIDNEGITPIVRVYDAFANIQKVLRSNLKFAKSLWTNFVSNLSKELCERRKLIMYDFLERDVNLDDCYKNGSIIHYVYSNYDEGTDEIIELFLKKGADVNIINKEKLTLLLRATVDGREKLVSILLNNGANVDCIEPKDNLEPLLIATSKFKPKNSYGSIIKMLLDHGANPNAKKSDGSSAIHNLVKGLRRPIGVPLTTAFINAGANINCQDSNGLTPLHLVCESNNHDIANLLLQHGADISVEDNNGRSVICYFFERNLENKPRYLPIEVACMMGALEKQIIRMNVIGLPVSAKVLSSSAKFHNFEPRNDQANLDLISECKREVQVLRDTRINGSFTLYDAMMKNDNTFSRLVKDPTFEDTCTEICKTSKNKYPQYSYLIKLKYKAGVDRGKLLPAAKCVLNELVGQHLPEECSENICKYFTNFELKEAIDVLRKCLDLNVIKSGDRRSARLETNKRRKIN